MTARSQAPTESTSRRADARRNVERILDGALDELARDQQASMAAVARRAGVARATLYAHFPTREELIAAVTERAIDDCSQAIRAADPGDGDPAQALERVIAAAWRRLGRYHALVAINTSRGYASLRALHEPVVGLVRPILKRGQASGAFSADVPLEWLLAVFLELVHAASREVSAGRLPEDVAERALVAAVTGALSG